MSFISNWKEKIAHYIEIRLNLIKLGLIERISGILSYLIFIFISLFLAASILIFVGIAIGEYFATVLDSRAGGFSVTAVFYILLMAVMLVFRMSIIRAFSNMFIRELTAKDDDETDETTDKGARTRDNIKVE